MTTRPCYFVVSVVNDREVPCLYWDELPPNHPIRKLVYVIRLDQLPNGDAMCKATLSQLYTTFCYLRERGNLPPRWEPPPRPQAQKAKPLTGHREYHPRRFMPDLPYEE